MKNKLILSIFASAFLFTSCGDEFLDSQPTEFLTADRLGELGVDNPDLLAGTVTGIYTMMITTGTGGTTNHTDFGQKGYDIMSDMLCGDMALSANQYGWYRDLAQLQSNQDFTDTDNYMPFRYYYRVIRSCNLAIETLGGNDFVPETDATKHLMGQAKALRGYAYFYLTQLFAREYDPAREILPLYTDPTSQSSLPKSPSSDIYAQIEKDLTEAIDLLANFERTQKVEINQYVAKGLLAYTYAAMGRDGEVKTLTDDIINNGGFPMATTAQLTGGFNDINAAPDWMWGFDLTNNEGLDLISWWGQMDLFTYSYAWAGDQKAIDRDLYNAIPVNDARKAQFTTNGTYLLMPVNKFFHANRTIGGQRQITSDYVYMRVDEMHLLNAEASAKSGDEAAAKTRLKNFLALRVPNTDYVDGLSGATLLNEIYKQTRIEFWGEGKSYLAMKRNKATVKRGSNHLFLVGEEFQYNDPKLMFSIPQAEILNNININEQN